MVVIVNTLTHATFSFYADCRYVSNANVMSLFLSIIGDYDSTMVVMYVTGDGYSILTLWSYSWIRGFGFTFYWYIYSFFISGQPFFYIRIFILYIRIVTVLYPDSRSFIFGKSFFISG